MVETLTTPRLILRPLRPSDAGPMSLYASDPRVARMTTSIPHPYPPGAAEAYIERQATNPRDEAWAIDATPSGGSELVGVIAFKTEAVEMGYWVGPPFWNSGYVSEALGAVLSHLFEARGLNAIGASVFADNPASARVLEKAGFVETGTTMQYSVAREDSALSRMFVLTREAMDRRVVELASTGAV
ncbi:MAG: GNAT family N-acetyltransferase [Pseudomonadota bacterium]